jgi:hypothetical protein
MKTLTAKYIHEKLKRNWTASDFARDLGISTDEFWNLLKKQFPGHSYKEFRISLKANEKHARRTTTSNIFSSSASVNTASTETSSDIASISAESDIPEAESAHVASQPIVPETPETDIPTPVVEKSSPTLDELLSELEQLRSDINAEELVHKDIVSVRCEIRTALQSHNQALIDLRQQIAQRKENITQLLSQLATTATQMHESTLRSQALQEANHH